MTQRPKPRMGRVVVLGGGVAGMSAAQELAERGFEVVVLERGRIPGGKARSIPVGGEDGASHLGKLPGEHGFRFFAGFYKHVVDTMSRIPSLDGKSAADHLVETTRVAITQYERPIFQVPAIFPRSPGDAGALLRDAMLLFGPTIDLTPEELAFFGARFWQLATTCAERRMAEYERTSWWDFIGASSRSPAYQKFLATGFTRSLVAAKAEMASARTVGDMFLQMMTTILNPAGGAADRVLDGPTNMVWIDPWRAYLEKLDVRYETGCEVEEIVCEGGRIVGVAARRAGDRTIFRGDHYIAALPIERFVPLLNAGLLAADPKLAALRQLATNVEWMNGVQFFLRSDLPLAHGHVIHIDTEWALTSVSQTQFWRAAPPATFGDPEVRGVLSVDVSDWTHPGGDGRTAMQCSREEVVAETWRQLKRSINGEREILRDADLHSWFLDPDIQPDPARPGYLANSEPLLVNLKNTWALRPDAATAISNLFLASDYVRTHTDLATMEGANEAARRAVNGILEASRYAGPRCAIWPMKEPECLTPWRLYDAERFKAGLPWDATLTTFAGSALEGSGLAAAVRPLIEAVAPFAAPLANALDPAPRSPPALADNGPTGFAERMTWYRDMIGETMAGAVPKTEPRRHLYDLVDEFVARPGKGLRPAFLIATARALGGRAEDAIPAAAGLELLHNAFLVHDDIEDGSDTRRGVPTLHIRVGLPIAVNTGDAMNALSTRLFRKAGERLGPRGAIRVLEEVDHLIVETLEGQAMELGWMRDNDLDVTPDDYMRLVLKKTAWYSFIHPMRLGALIADCEDSRLDRFDALGFLIGLAFQVTDDVLNLDGSVEKYGKEIDGDLYEGKRTLMLTHAIAHATPRERAFIDEFLQRPRERRQPHEVTRLKRVIADTGGLEWGRSCATAFAEAALRRFDEEAFKDATPGPDLSWLRASVEFMVARDV